jgi:hypothetical protein
LNTVWKFSLEITDDQIVEMPEPAELLHVAEQYGRLMLWARVDPVAPLVNRLILIRGTGHSVGSQPHVGTVGQAGGYLVRHVFDGGRVG